MEDYERGEDVQYVEEGNFRTRVTFGAGKADRTSDPNDKFQNRCIAIMRKLNATDVFRFDEASISAVSNRAKVIKNAERKNATAFVLGFIASNGGKSLDEVRVKRIFTNVFMTSLDDKSITLPDVIRYARFWMRA